MAREAVTIKIAANFEANLAAIEAFLTQAQAQGAYDALLDELADELIPGLERFPRIGGPFLEQRAGSVQALGQIERLRAKLDDTELCELLTREYLILYAIAGDTVHLLSIKHQRQLSFDLASFWQSERPAP